MSQEGEESLSFVSAIVCAAIFLVALWWLFGNVPTHRVELIQPDKDGYFQLDNGWGESHKVRVKVADDNSTTNPEMP